MSDSVREEELLARIAELESQLLSYQKSHLWTEKEKEALEQVGAVPFEEPNSTLCFKLEDRRLCKYSWIGASCYDVKSTGNSHFRGRIYLTFKEMLQGLLGELEHDSFRYRSEAKLASVMERKCALCADKLRALLLKIDCK